MTERLEKPTTKRRAKQAIKQITKRTAAGFLVLLFLMSSPATMQGFASPAGTNSDSNTEQAALPANPAHHCTKNDDCTDYMDPLHYMDYTDYTDFSYIYFGSYPQSEVIDSATIAAIDSAIDTSGTAADAGIDVWVNDTKYRRIREDDCNNTNYFNNVENNGYRYFKWERIKWRVLDNNDNGSLFVMADSALDCKNYNDEYVNITWEKSTIRSWLNGSFYQTAFSSDEQSAITQWKVVNEGNPDYDAEGGNDTTDSVYLLPIGEMTNEGYGFCSGSDTWSGSRQMQPSEYAHARGVKRDTSTLYEGSCWWWLRSPGGCNKNAAAVADKGYVDNNGAYVNDDFICPGVAPVLHINLSSDLWSIVDDGSGDEGDGTPTGGNEKPSNPQPDSSQIDSLQPDFSQPAAPQPAGTSLTASQVTSRTDIIPQGASFTVTSGDPEEPTVSFDGVSDEDASAVNIPRTITFNGVEYKVTTVSPTAFSTKKDNASFTVTDNRVESLTVEYKAMSNAKKTKVTVAESTTYKGIKFKVTSVAAKAFKNNKKVKQVSVAGSVIKIGDGSFEGCSSLKSVTLGKGTATIGKNAFKNCKKLTKITIKSTKVKTVGKNALKGVNAKCKIKVPAKQLKKYQNLFKKKGQKNSVKLVK